MLEWGNSCGGNATMGYIKNDASQMGYTLCTESLIKNDENEKWAESHNGNEMKNHR